MVDRVSVYRRWARTVLQLRGVSAVIIVYSGDDDRPQPHLLERDAKCSRKYITTHKFQGK